MQRKDFTDPFGGKPGVFFFTSSHLETQMLFRNDNDFKYGVNSLAACLIGSSCSLLCYCLMSNHMHLLLYGMYKNCLAYYDHLIKRLSMWLSKERGITGLLRHNDVDIQAITDVRQLRNVALYTIRTLIGLELHRPYPINGAPLTCISTIPTIWNTGRSSQIFPHLKSEGCWQTKHDALKRTECTMALFSTSVL